MPFTLFFVGLPLVTLIKNSIARGWLLMIIAILWIMEVVMMLVIEVMVVAVMMVVVVVMMVVV